MRRTPVSSIVWFRRGADLGADPYHTGTNLYSLGSLSSQSAQTRLVSQNLSAEQARYSMVQSVSDINDAQVFWTKRKSMM
jgi:hypothetical protein